VVTKHIKYAKYVIRHKFFVMLECFKHGLIYRGLKHDISKFLPGEWFPYVEFFYGTKAKQVRDETGYYKPTDTGNKAFDFAWLLHQKRNDHHWQWWCYQRTVVGQKYYLCRCQRYWKCVVIGAVPPERKVMVVGVAQLV